MRRYILLLLFIGTFSFSQTNYSLSFDGADDYVDCGNDPSLNVTENFTIELWFKLEQWGSDDSDFYNYIVSKVSESPTFVGFFPYSLRLVLLVGKRLN